MSRACKKCGKTVYHAEVSLISRGPSSALLTVVQEQLYDGMIFHMGCFTIWNREKTQEDLGAPWFIQFFFFLSHIHAARSP